MISVQAVTSQIAFLGPSSKKTVSGEFELTILLALIPVSVGSRFLPS